MVPYVNMSIDVKIFEIWISEPTALDEQSNVGRNNNTRLQQVERIIFLQNTPETETSPVEADMQVVGRIYER